MNHWAVPYIGIPWVYGAQGPEAYDCWNFIRKIQLDHFGIDVPVVEYSDQREVSAHLLHNPELDRWTLVDAPQEGDIVMMARAKIPAHVGIWITANSRAGVLHCLEGMGVVFTASNMIRNSGWGSLKYYRRKT